jgi:hypothetical protein
VAIDTADTSQLRQSIGRLAQYRPFGSGEVQVEFARRELILAAAHENGGQFSSLADCQQVCKTLWGLDIDIDEIRVVVRRLEQAGRLERDGASYLLSSMARTELAERLDASLDTQDQAYTDWEISVQTLDPGISENGVNQLKEDLGLWLQRIITRYGLEAALLLYPEEGRAERFLADLQEMGFSFLPTRDAPLEEIRPKALYAFIHRPTAAQRIYLANLLTTAYLAAIFTLDPRAKEVVQSLTKGQRIYLDTNIVYGVLNLSGPRSHLATRRVLELSRELGYEICVTPWTVEEMKQSVRRARDKLAGQVLPPRALAEVAAETSGDETFITAYWRKYKETGVSPDDFLDFHEQIDGLLEQARVTIVDTSCLAVDRDSDAIAGQVGLLEQAPGGADKPRPVQEHDVKHRLLVERLRGHGNRRFSNGGYWFLTKDNVLIPYGLTGRERPDALPFAISLTTWATIVRSLCPRTDDYDQTLADLLDTPSVRPRGVVSPATIAEVLGRIDMLVEDSTEEIATRLLLDSAAMSAIEDKENSQRQRLIDSAVKEKRAEMERQLRETQAQATSERAAREAAEEKARAMATELEQERIAHAEAKRHRQEEAERLVRERERTATIRQDLDAETRQHLDDVQSLEGRVASQERLLRSVIAGGIAMVGVAVIAVPIATSWVRDGWPLIAALLAGGGMVVAAVAWFAGRRKRLAW